MPGVDITCLVNAVHVTDIPIIDVESSISLVEFSILLFLLLLHSTPGYWSNGVLDWPSHVRRERGLRRGRLRRGVVVCRLECIPVRSSCLGRFQRVQKSASA